MPQEKTYALDQATTPLTPFNTLQFAINRAKAITNNCTIVQVKKVTIDGEVAQIGRVDVLPLVNMVDGRAQILKHQIIHNICYCRVTSGNRAIIIDPTVGDIGIAVFSDRDISKVKATKKQAAPGSGRKNNMADGIYVTAVLSDVPTSYILSKSDGSWVITPDSGTTFIKIEAGHITLQATRIDHQQP